MIYVEFNNAIKERDGIRVVQCLRFFYSSSEQQTEQIMYWKQLDLHMEHLNCTAKETLGPQAYLNPKAVSCVGNCISLFQNVCRQFDMVSDTHHSSGKHCQSSETTDLHKGVNKLIHVNVFQTTRNCCHKGFETIG